MSCHSDMTEILLNRLPDDKILDWSKLKQSADDNFKFDVNSRKFSKLVENTVGKVEIARYEQFLLFPVFCPEIKSTGTNGPLSLKKVGHFRKYGAQYDANSLSALIRQVEKTLELLNYS